MPYIYVEELQEGQEVADVLSREDYDALNEQLTNALNQRDTAIERAVEAEKMYGEIRQKYADTFLGRAYNPKPFNNEDEKIKPITYDNLFKEDDDA